MKFRNDQPTKTHTKAVIQFANGAYAIGVYLPPLRDGHIAKWHISDSSRNGHSIPASSITGWAKLP